jgi:hypothetical protein
MDTSSEETPANRSDAGSTAVPVSESPSRRDRLRAWCSAHPLYVEASLAVAAIALGVLAAPIVAFGSLVALGGETRILEIGMIVVVVGESLLVVLAVAALAHARLDVRRGALRAAGGARGVAYVGSRVLQTLTAAALLLGLAVAAVSLAARGAAPEPLAVIVGAASVLLPVLVLVHATGRIVGTALDRGSDR